MDKIVFLSYIKQLHDNIRIKNGLIQVLLGPRQVGKTTTVFELINRHYKDVSHYASADSVFNSDSSWLREQWMHASSNGKILFIDEIQKSYNWAETIKVLYDESIREKRLVKCVLLGSSSLEIQKGLTESLTGRFQLIRAHHWNYHESREGYNLSMEEFYKFGGYPGSYNLRKNGWADYVKNSIISTVIEKDILQFRTVKNPALFKQAFEILTAYPAQEISYTKLLGQLQEKGNVEIIKHYINLYEGAFLIKALEKFSPKVLKQKSSSPKILPLAPCLYYLNVRDKYANDEKGRILELLVGAQLVRTGEELFYWREGKYEVDYVLKIGKSIWAIEVKSGRKKSIKGLEVFKNKFPDAKLVLITEKDYPVFEEDPLRFINKY